jgi:hypothetical protein
VEPQPIDQNKPLAGAITPQEWDALFAAATSPHLIVAPAIVNKLVEQLRRQSQPQITTDEMVDRVA